MKSSFCFYVTKKKRTTYEYLHTAIQANKLYIIITYVYIIRFASVCHVFCTIFLYWLIRILHHRQWYVCIFYGIHKNWIVLFW